MLLFRYDADAFRHAAHAAASVDAAACRLDCYGRHAIAIVASAMLRH